MPGIPNTMHNRLRETLLECSPFESNSQLSAVFTNELLIPWRNQVPQGSNPSDRVDSVINFLINKWRVDTKENAFVIFLRVLSAQKDKTDQCYQSLTNLADDLDLALSAASNEDQQAFETAITAQTLLPSTVEGVLDTTSPQLMLSNGLSPLESRGSEQERTSFRKLDHNWLISILNVVIEPMSQEGIKNLLRGSLSNNSIDRINLKEGSLNIAETIIGRLEQKDKLNSPFYHAQCSFLNNLVESDVLHDTEAARRINEWLLSYNQFLSKAQTTVSEGSQILAKQPESGLTAKNGSGRQTTEQIDPSERMPIELHDVSPISFKAGKSLKQSTSVLASALAYYKEIKTKQIQLIPVYLMFGVDTVEDIPPEHYNLVAYSPLIDIEDIFPEHCELAILPLQDIAQPLKKFYDLVLDALKRERTTEVVQLQSSLIIPLRVSCELVRKVISLIPDFKEVCQTSPGDMIEQRRVIQANLKALKEKLQLISTSMDSYLK
jgi:hypothetical protein